MVMKQQTEETIMIKQKIIEILKDNNKNLSTNLLDLIVSSSGDSAATIAVIDRSIFCFVGCLKIIVEFDSKSSKSLSDFAQLWLKASSVLSLDVMFKISSDFCDEIEWMYSNVPLWCQNRHSINDRLDNIQTFIFINKINKNLNLPNEEENYFTEVSNFLFSFFIAGKELKDDNISNFINNEKMGFNRIKLIIDKTSKEVFIYHLLNELSNNKKSFYDAGYIILILENLFLRILKIEEMNISLILKSKCMMLILELSKLLHKPYPTKSSN
jgi:hypothetical protein